jgi:hypothetical protein
MKHDFAASLVPRRGLPWSRSHNGRQPAEMVWSMDFCGEYA